MKKYIKSNEIPDSRLDYYNLASQITCETPYPDEIYDFMDTVLQEYFDVMFVRASNSKYPRQGTLRYIAMKSKSTWDEILDYIGMNGQFSNIWIHPPKPVDWSDYKIIEVYD